MPTSYDAPVGESILDIARQQAVRDLAMAGFNMSYTQFRHTLGLEPDAYAEGKYQTFQQIGRLLGNFDDHSLQALVYAYKRR